MEIRIDDAILERYPEASIGYVVAEVAVEGNHPHVQALTSTLKKTLASLGIDSAHLDRHPDVKSWRQVFSHFGRSKEYRSSVEALVQRVVNDRPLWQVSSIVDLYNCCSVLSLTPMGGYDLERVTGDITLRFGQPSDIFVPLNGDAVEVRTADIVYADQEQVISWLWNYRDAAATAITLDTTRALFFFDAACTPHHMSLAAAIALFKSHLSQLGATILLDGLLSAAHPRATVCWQDAPAQAVLPFDYATYIACRAASMPASSPAARPKIAPPVHKDIPFIPLPLSQLATPAQAIHAAATGDLTLLEQLLTHDPALLQSTDSHGNPLLFHAVCGDHLSVVQWLLQRDPDATTRRNSAGNQVWSIIERGYGARCKAFLEPYRA